MADPHQRAVPPAPAGELDFVGLQVTVSGLTSVAGKGYNGKRGLCLGEHESSNGSAKRFTVQLYADEYPQLSGKTVSLKRENLAPVMDPIRACNAHGSERCMACGLDFKLPNMVEGLRASVMTREKPTPMTKIEHEIQLIVHKWYPIDQDIIIPVTPAKANVKAFNEGAHFRGHPAFEGELHRAAKADITRGTCETLFVEAAMRAYSEVSRFTALTSKSTMSKEAGFSVLAIIEHLQEIAMGFFTRRMEFRDAWARARAARAANRGSPKAYFTWVVRGLDKRARLHLVGARACDECGKRPGPMRICARCQDARYCSDACAKTAWHKGGHMAACAPAAAVSTYKAMDGTVRNAREIKKRVP